MSRCLPHSQQRGVGSGRAESRAAIGSAFEQRQDKQYRLLVEAKDVPSLGYSLLHVVPGKRPFASDLKASGTTIENAPLKVTVDPQTGCITSLYDKKANFEALAQGPAATS